MTYFSNELIQIHLLTVSGATCFIFWQRHQKKRRPHWVLKSQKVPGIGIAKLKFLILEIKFINTSLKIITHIRYYIGFLMGYFLTVLPSSVNFGHSSEALHFVGRKSTSLSLIGCYSLFKY